MYLTSNYIPKSLDFGRVTVKDNIATFSLSLPVELVDAFPALLASLSEMFSFLRHQTRVASVDAKHLDPDYLAELKKRNAAYSARILKIFDKHQKLGKTPRECFRDTKAELAKQGLEVTSYVVEITARRAGRLSTRKQKQK